MAVNYKELFDLAYSTSIPESVKEAVFSRVEVPITEGLELPADVCECVEFLDELACSSMSEDLANEMIDKVFEGCSEEYLEEVYEAYVQAKAIQYVSEEEYKGDAFSPITKSGTARKSTFGLPAAVRERMRQEAQAKQAAKGKAQKAEARREAIKGFFNKAKAGVSNTVNAAKNAIVGGAKATAEAGRNATNQVKNTAIDAKNKAVDTATATGNVIKNKAIETGEKVKAATEPARDLASYTAHKAVEGGKSFLNKIKGAVGKVKEWGKNYMAQAKAYGDANRAKAKPYMKGNSKVADSMTNDLGKSVEKKVEGKEPVLKK